MAQQAIRGAGRNGSADFNLSATWTVGFEGIFTRVITPEIAPSGATALHDRESN
jgi:hypothetical protein